MSELASARPANAPRRRFRGRTRVALIAVLAIAVLALVAWRPVLTGLGRFLVVDEPPVPSDVVIVSGGGVDRIAYGVELVRGGTSPRLLVLVNPQDCPRFWGFRCDQAIVRRLLEMGLRREQVIIEERSHSTHTDAVYSRQDMEREGLASAVVISEPFHMRRISWAWRRAFADTGVRLTFTSIPFEQTGMSLEGWWTRERELLFVFSEYVKLGLYWVKGYL
ncbi:MAG: YdcF family protein [bacterium]|nr:YdcF family protein [bacterium]